MVKNIPKASSGLIFDEKTVTKEFSSEIPLVTLIDKHSELARIGKMANFSTPAVVDTCAEKNQLIFSRVDLSLPMSKYVQSILNSNESVERALSPINRIGESLGYLHNELTLQTQTDTAAIEIHKRAGNSVLESEEGGTERVYIHGDFGLNNIFIDDSENLTIIDPVPNHTTAFYIDEHTDGVVDLSLVCNSIIRQLSMRKYSKSRIQDVRQLIFSLVTGYEKVVRRKVSLSSLLHYCSSTDKLIARKRLTNAFLRAYREKCHSYILRQIP
jgi:tRNA A-37 threonylcarbamoyl transferase component Bud32